MKYLSGLDIDGMIFCSGAGIMLGSTVIRKRCIPSETVRKLISLGKQSRTGLLIQGREHGYIDRICRERMNRILTEKKKISEQAYERTEILLGGLDADSYRDEEIYKIDFHFTEETDTGLFKSGIDSRMDVVYMLSMHTNQRNGGEMTMPGINKGEAIRWLVSYMGGDMSETYGFGDSLNDLSMLEACAVSVAMGDSAPELLQKAHYVTDDLHHDGIMNALKHFDLV